MRVINQQHDGIVICLPSDGMTATEAAQHLSHAATTACGYNVIVEEEHIGPLAVD